MKILIFGLPGAGKTTLAIQLAYKLNFKYFNADLFRAHNEDWDFSIEGRNRQLQRMIIASNSVLNSVCDFICPTNKFRKEFNADFTIWVNTIDSCKYTDTNLVFEIPETKSLTISNYEYNIDEIVKIILTSPRELNNDILQRY